MSDEHTITGDKQAEGCDNRSVNHFATDMVFKLRKNAHKAHWSTVDCWYLLDRLEDEIKELREALTARHSITPKTNDKELSKDIILKCADVANFAMMIADNERD